MVQWSAGQRFIGSVDNCHPRAQTQPQIMFGASRSVASSYLICLKRVENNLKKNSRASSAAEKETVRQFWPCHKNFKYFFLRNSLTFSDENYVLVYSENFHYIQEPYSNILVLWLILELRKVRLTLTIVVSGSFCFILTKIIKQSIITRPFSLHIPMFGMEYGMKSVPNDNWYSWSLPCQC